MQEQDSNLFSEVTIDESAKTNIAGIASWAMIIVVTAVIGYVLTIIELFTKPTVTAFENDGFRSSVATEGAEIAGAFITIGIGLLINYFLYRFAKQSKSSLVSHSQVELADSFRNLKIYFAITSVLMILGLLFILVLIAAGL